MDVVNFDNAPSVTLFKGKMSDLIDTLGNRVRVKYDARKEMRKKKKAQQEKIKADNEKEMMKGIRETNVIKRTVVDDLTLNSGKDEENIFLKNSPRNKVDEFDVSQERINNDLLSRAPDHFKNKINSRQGSQDNKLNSNFTYGKESQNISGGVKANKYASEVVMDPLTNEVRIKRKSHKKVITKSEYEKILIKNKGKQKVTTINAKVETKPVAKTLPQIRQDNLKIQNPKSTTSLNSNQPTRYLKLVVDDQGRKKYQMVSVEGSMNSGQNSILKETPESSVKNHVYKTQGTPQSTGQTPMGGMQGINGQIVQRPKANTAYPGSYQQNSNFSSRQNEQRNYTVYRGTQTGNQGPGQNFKQNFRVKTNEANPSYRSYNYSGNSRRYQSYQSSETERQVMYHKSPSPISGEGHPRKSSRKVIVYRNGVKVSEKMYTGE